MGDTVETKRAHGRSLADFWLDGEEGKLHPAERRIVDACAKGEVCDLGDVRPEATDPAKLIRAGLLRFLALGGDAQTPVHEHGVHLIGAWIDGTLDLDCAAVPARLAIQRSRIETLIVRDARLRGLYMDGCCVEAGIAGDRLHGEGGVFLRNGFRATGEVRLLGAEIGGDLDCSGGTFGNASGSALSCDGAKVAGGFFFREIEMLAGGVGLYSCHVGTLVDDPASWAGVKGNLILDGFTYGRIDGDPAFVDAALRIAWLKSQCPDHLTTEFRPQPWEQLIKVLRETGHPNAARKVAIAKQEQMRVAGRFAGIRRPIHRLYGAFVGYGYRPERLLYAMSALWLGFGLVFLWGSADHVGRIAPGPTLFLNAPEPRDVPRHSPLHDFDPWRWSLDALLPIDLGYTATAHPDEARWQGRVLGWMAVFETLFGWIASLLLVASVTNLLKKD